MSGGLVVRPSTYARQLHIMVNQCAGHRRLYIIQLLRPIMSIHIIIPLMVVIMAAIIITADTLDTVGDTLVIGGGDVPVGRGE